MHRARDAHETAYRAPAAALAGTGAAATAQCLPLHDRASGRTELVPLVKLPTAVHAEREEQDTPDRVLAVALVRATAGVLAQFLPFHVSPTAVLVPSRVKNPTARQAALDEHEIPDSEP